MIVFQKLRWKNFLSTGNTWTEIDLAGSKSTLIVGHNGAGKSTLLDALSFGLFGKPHRNINKPQLVNTINNKDCLVEVNFQVGVNTFKVVRGIKPQVFEIWKGDIMINQASRVAEYQKILEQNIIKLNHKSFHQIVVLGSSSFVPFMQLPGQTRRDVIEDLLDIGVFSKMNNLIREKNSLLREGLKDATYQLDIIKNKIESQRKYIHDITKMNDDEIAAKLEQIEDLTTEIQEIQVVNSDSSSFVEGHQTNVETELKRANDKKQSILQYKSQFQTSMKTVVKDAKFYEGNTKCPTCTQGIGEDLRDEKLNKAKGKARELQSALRRAQDEAEGVTATIEEYSKLFDDIRVKQNLIHNNNQAITRLQQHIGSLNGDITRLSAREGDLGSANVELQDLTTGKDALTESRMKLNEEYSYNGVMAEMLKDTGIKTKVIKQYLPVINKLVNQYLSILDFFVHFDLDENFQETVRSRHRDVFSYASFSEGEKQRIDLALLFTWRMIAKMKNSVATNLLILDETFDSSLDHDGVENLIKIIKTLGEDTNVFVISHKGEILEGRFKAKLEFFKDKNFSTIKHSIQTNQE